MQNNLKNIRKASGMTQEELAEKVGTSKSYISQLESGARNIKAIRTDTTMRLCSVLNCLPEQLYEIPVLELEFRNDRLVVDGAYFDSSVSTRIVLDFGGTLYCIHTNKLGFFDKKTQALTGDNFVLYNKAVMPECQLDNGDFWILGLCPRVDSTPTIGRAITTEEWDALVEKYELTEEKISSEFVETKRSLFDRENGVEYTSRQISVDPSAAIPLETELKSKGIEASNGSPCRVNIRVK